MLIFTGPTIHPTGASAMICENSWSRRRALAYLAACAQLAAITGCGGEAPKASAPEPKKSNDNDAMANFMKSQQQQKKKR
jgi:hypothetical protein